MKCDEVRQHWELYYDSEGDSELYLRVNEHLAACPACSKWFFDQARFEDALAARLVASAPTPELWQRILTETGIARPVATRGWAFFSSFFALAASLIIVVGLWQLVPDSESDKHLSALTAAVHEQLASGSERLEFASASDEAVECYLKDRVPFPVRCPPRSDAGFVVQGGGVCDIAGETAAYVFGKVEGGDVSVFILPERRLAEFVHERDALRREAVHHCREGAYDMVLAKIDRNIVVVIGHGKPEQLEKVVRAYGTYPDNPASNHTPPVAKLRRSLTV
jgi:anti-sigma factor RsiW